MSFSQPSTPLSGNTTMTGALRFNAHLIFPGILLESIADDT
jgi:hypothetical protein